MIVLADDGYTNFMGFNFPTLRYVFCPKKNFLANEKLHTKWYRGEGHNILIILGGLDHLLLFRRLQC